jgi:hypothetical protein
MLKPKEKRDTLALLTLKPKKGGTLVVLMMKPKERRAILVLLMLKPKKKGTLWSC